MAELTERELFNSIYDLGGQIWRVRHDLADERITSTPEMEQWLVDAQQKIQAMVASTVDHGVSCPLNKDDCATPEYWDWYHRMKEASEAGD